MSGRISGTTRRGDPPRPLGRPRFANAVRALIRDAARRLPEFAHLKASRILVVSGEARRASRATIRPLGARSTRLRAARPRIVIQGRRMLYVITLRPAFFRNSTPEARVETLLHELFHISERFDGTLHRDRRHSMLPGKRFGAMLAPLVRRYLGGCDADLLAAFGHHGEVLTRQWLEKPPIRFAVRSGRRTYGEDQLFLGPVMMVTRR